MKKIERVKAKLRSRKKFDFLILFISTLFTCRSFLSLNQPFIAGTDSLDFHFGEDKLWKDIASWFSTWASSTTCGHPSTPFPPIQLIFRTFLLTLNISTTIAIKLFVLILFFLAAVSMYLFTYRLSKNRIGAIISAMFYVYNQFFLSEIISEGHYAKMIGYSLAPIVFMLLEETLETPKLQNIVLLSIITTLFLSTANQPILLILVFGFLYVLSWILKGNKTKRIKIAVRVSFLAALLSLSLSMYWLLPEVFVTRTSSEIFTTTIHAVEDAYFFSYKSIKDALTIRNTVENLGGQRILFWEYPPLQQTFINILIYFIPILAFSAILIRKDRHTIFFSSASLISSLLALGPHLFPPQIFNWLWTHVPGYSTFRVGGRFLMITALSYSYLIGIIVGWAYKKLSKIQAFSPRNSITKYFYKNTNKIFLFSIITLIITYSWTGSVIGFQVYNWPNSYVEPYEYLKHQNGDFRVLNIPNNRRMTNPYPWSSSGLSLGFYSYGISNKDVFATPTPYFGKHYSLSGSYIVFINNLIKHNLTNMLGQMLGIANVRYIVLDPNASISERSFFNRQEGLEMTPFKGEATIFENTAHPKHFFPTQNSILLVGGRNDLIPILNIDEFNLSDWMIHFLHSANLDRWSPDMIILSNNNFFDFPLTLYGMDYVLDASKYASPISYDASKYWITSRTSLEKGEFTFGDNSLKTTGNAKVDIPLNVIEDGEYEISLRIAFGPNRGILSAKLDNETILKNFQPSTSYPTRFDWVKLRSVYLSKGKHKLTLINDGSGANWIDAILLIRSSEFQRIYDQALNTIQRLNSRVVFVVEVEKTFAKNQLVGWHLSQQWGCNASNGYVLTSNELSEGSTLLTIPKTGDYKISMRMVNGRNYGNLVLRIDGKAFRLSCNDSTTRFVWHDLGPIPLESGEHLLEIINDGVGKLDLDELILYSIKEDEDNISLKEVFSTPQNTEVAPRKLSATEYNVNVKTDRPFWLIFSESYHPLWRAYIDDKEIQPIAAYSFINGFYINKTGEYSVKIYFTGQNYFIIGSFISIATLLSTAMYLTHTRWYRKLKTFKLR